MTGEGVSSLRFVVMEIYVIFDTQCMLLNQGVINHTVCSTSRMDHQDKACRTGLASLHNRLDDLETTTVCKALSVTSVLKRKDIWIAAHRKFVQVVLDQSLKRIGATSLASPP